jgi:hypothetical protein
MKMKIFNMKTAPKKKHSSQTMNSNHPTKSGEIESSIIDIRCGDFTPFAE